MKLSPIMIYKISLHTNVHIDVQIDKWINDLIYIPMNFNMNVHEIWCGGQSLSCELKFQVSGRSMHKCVRTSCKRTHSR